MTKGVLVIGGGIAGIQASLDLADSGVQVYLVERGPSLGGRMAQLDKTFPTNDCAMCIISPKLVAATRHPNIKLFTMSEVGEVTGEAGDFEVTVLKHPRFVDESKCIGCALCTGKCPSKVENEFDMGTGYRKAIYIPFPQAAPLKYTIDPGNCIYFKMLEKGREGACMLCVKVCESDAINHKMVEEKVTFNVGSIIAATGYDLIDPNVRAEYGYDSHDNVITAIEFERYLSASGPTSGKIIRPSDGEEAKRIAFIQCYGSRDDHHGCSYCSRVCCMYAIKEAMLVKEHEPDVEDISIFYMDIRAYGKGFEEYYERARNQYGVNFFRGRPGRLIEDSVNQNIIIQAESTTTGEIVKHVADLVVLSSAIVPSEGSKELAEILKIESDEFGYFKEQMDSLPTHSSREGIYICGCAQGPKDIPDTVAQASGAAAEAGMWVKDHRIADEETDVPMMDLYEKPRVGVFVCHCGTNIASVVDVKAVAEFAKTLPYVAYTDDCLYTCSDNTQRDIQKLMKEHSLNRVVISACTPRTHEPIFQQMLEEGGLNPYLFEMVNIRDQNSWVHQKEHNEATQKAMDLVASGVAKSISLRPLKAHMNEVTPTALVVGGGVSGLTSALDLSKLGFETHLIEKEPFLGGQMSERGLLAPAFIPASEILNERFMGIEENGVHIHTNTTIDDIEGFVGNFVVHATEHPIGVSEDTCNLCGDCEKVCPVEVTGSNGVTRKAIWYKTNVFPERYAIDFENCTKCGECAKVCKTDSIDLDSAETNNLELDIGAIVLAIGSELYQPEQGEFGFGIHSNVITNETLERKLLNITRTGEKKLVLNGKELKKVALIHCVGSRDPEGFAGCSRYCCQVALKQANVLRDLGVEVVDYCRDIRAFSKAGEQLYQDTRAKGVTYFRYTPESKPDITTDGDQLKIRIRDDLIDTDVELGVDAVILSVGMRSHEEDSKYLRGLLKVPLGQNNFFLESHPKLAPVDTNTSGIYICGCAQYPKDSADSIAQASATAARATTILSKDKLKGEANIAIVDTDRCSGCETCIMICPYNAIDKLDGKARVNEALCKGCGSCAGICRNGAIQQKGFFDDQIISMIDAILEEDV